MPLRRGTHILFFERDSFLQFLRFFLSKSETMSTLISLTSITSILHVHPDRAMWSRLYQKWTAYLRQPVDGASVAAFRFLFGAFLFWEVLWYFRHGWIERYYIAPTFHFTYPFLDFVRPWPGNGMYIHFTVMGVLALFIALGLFYRVAAPLFCLAFAYVFLLDKAYYLNHFYLIVLLSFLLSLVPAHRAASLDRWLYYRNQAPVVPQWSVFLLQAQIFIVYFYGGLAKLNPDWLRGEPIRMWLAERTDFPVIGSTFTWEWVVYAFAHGGLVFDLGICFLLSWKRARPFAFGLAGVFHLVNSQLFNIGIFPPLAFAATLIFAEPSWPRRVGRAIPRAFAVFWAKAQTLSVPSETDILVMPKTGQRPRLVMLAFLHLYLLAQLLIPFRHLLYPGNVSWTEEGHRFSWHMKLRDKEAILHFYLTDPRTGATWEISPALDLSARQLNEMSTRPDMVLQYAHHLAERWGGAGQPRPTVRVDLRVSLNGRPWQPLIDPNVNLAEAPFSLGTANWILPLTAPLQSRVEPLSQERHS